MKIKESRLSETVYLKEVEKVQIVRQDRTADRIYDVPVGRIAEVTIEVREGSKKYEQGSK